MGETKAFLQPLAIGLPEARAKRFLVSEEGEKRVGRVMDAMLSENLFLGTRLERGKLYLESRDKVGALMRMWLFRTAGLPDFLRVFFGLAQEDRGCQRLIEKTPEHIFFLPEIWTTFPRAQVIFCYRHPVNVLGSYRRRLEAQLSRGDDSPVRTQWLKMSPEHFSEEYRKRLILAEKAVRDRPSQMKMVKYEDLTSHLVRTVGGVCHFLGEPLEEGHLPPSIDSADEKNYEAGHSHVMSTPRDWKRYLSWPEALRTQSLLRDLMVRFNYADYLP